MTLFNTIVDFGICIIANHEQFFIAAVSTSTSKSTTIHLSFRNW